MILIDSRVGSKHLAALLGDNAILTQLDYGDAAWSGNGITVGVEIKTVLDAVSCLYSGRLADHQIPGLKASYDVVYLIIEGIWRPSPEGVLQYFKWFPSKKETVCGQWMTAVNRKPLMYSAFESWLQSLASLGGVSVRSTPSSDTTAALLLSLHNWYQRESHESFKAIHQAEGNGAVLSRPTMLRRMLALLPHIGWDRSAMLLSRVKGVAFRGSNGSYLSGEDWYVEGQIAEKSAEDIDRACSGEEQ